MKQINCAILILALGTLLASVPSCMEQIALFPRPNLPEGEPDVIAFVERVDVAARLLYLRLPSGERRTAFTDQAQVFYRGREFPITRLLSGDVVAMQIKQDSLGESYVDLIRLQQDARSDRDYMKSPLPRHVLKACREQFIA